MVLRFYQRIYDFLNDTLATRGLEAQCEEEETLFQQFAHTMKAAFTQSNAACCRCTLPQLEILATTLEPLRHRDPLAASRRQASVVQLSASVKGSASLKCTPSRLPSITPQSSPTKSAHRSKKDSTPGSKDGERFEKPGAGMNLDQYASMLSSAVLATALGEISLAEKLDSIAQTETNAGNDETAVHQDGVPSDHAGMKVVATSVPRETSHLSSATWRDGEASQKPPPSANTRPGILRSSNGKRPDKSRNASAQFLGGQISFTPQSRQSRRSHRSGSSRYRYSAFASSAASTPDFFLREKLNSLGMFVCFILLL